MKMIKFIKYGLFAIFFLWWFFLSHVTFLPSFLERMERSEDNYHVVFYDTLPINPIGLYYFLTKPAPYFAVLYKDNKYIGQSYPYYMVSDAIMIGDNYGFPHGKLNYFYILCCDEYDIPVKDEDKKW
ncbi:DUF6201 family protein, partial [Enterobacter hormaechei]|nr:DUF6201 family protein [Enterobacter hormaechei]